MKQSVVTSCHSNPQSPCRPVNCTLSKRVSGPPECQSDKTQYAADLGACNQNASFMCIENDSEIRGKTLWWFQLIVTISTQYHVCIHASSGGPAHLLGHCFTECTRAWYQAHCKLQSYFSKDFCVWPSVFFRQPFHKFGDILQSGRQDLVRCSKIVWLLRVSFIAEEYPYTLNDTATTWEDANRTCVARGQQLVVMETEAKIQKVIQFVLLEETRVRLVTIV